MEKTDLLKLDKTYYTARLQPRVIDIGQKQFLSLTGKGDPGGKDFAKQLEVLYSTAYALKFICKEAGKDFVMPKLEGLWSFDEKQFSGLSITDAPAKVPRDQWIYRLLIRMPGFVQRAELTSAINAVVHRKGLAAAKNIELVEMNEGLVVQMLHVGPFSSEPETLLKMQEFMRTHHLQRNGLHHEIYLSDFRRTAPEKLRTILREPVRRS